MKKFWIFILILTIFLCGWISLVIYIKLPFTWYSFILYIIGFMLLFYPALSWWNNYFEKLFKHKD